MKAKCRIVGSIAAVVLLVALVVIVAFRAFGQIRESAEARKRAFIVIHSGNELLSTLINAETDQRGYLLTGDETFLVPYSAARASLSGHLKELRRLTLSSAANKHLDAMTPMMDAKLAYLSDNIELRRKHSMAAALANVRGSRGKRLMDSIRAEMSSVIKIEEDALAKRDIEFQSSMRQLFTFIVLASVFTLLIALAFAYMVYRETQHRLKNLVHLETQNLLEIQSELNKQLQLANNTLEVSEEKLAVTLNSIGDAVIATDAQGRVTLLNPLAQKLTGWTLTEADGRPVDEIFHIINEETREPANIPVAETLARGTLHGLANHTVLIARDGSECSIADSCAPIRDRDKKVVGAVLVFRDVTKEYASQQALRENVVELKRFDQALRETNVDLESAKTIAEKANLAKSDFLSGMSHELRSPLNAILGFAQLMESDSPPPSPAQQESIAQILQAGWYLLDLINEILDLAKIESGKITLSMEPVSIAEVMLEIQTMMEPQVQERHIPITFPNLDSPYFVHADRTRLKQVLINILSNAIKYNREGGTIIVDSAEVTPERIRISVTDTGMGLPPEKVAQLFQSFNRLGQDIGAEEGTGIGLVMSKRLVELMDGVIGVESAVGVGSTFWIELRSDAAPAFLVEAIPAALARAQHQASAPLHTLLYVEDNPANLKLVEQLIARHADLRLLTAVDASLGIELARTFQPEIILMDINLPGISGIEALRILREDPTTAHIPVVGLTANAMPRDIEKGMAAGFFRYITKPIRVKEFEDTLQVALAFAKESRAPALGVSETGVIGADEMPFAADAVNDQYVADADASDALPQAASAPLPDELIGRLREAAMSADHDLLLLLTDEVDRYDMPKAEQIRHHIEAFDYQLLLDAVGTGG